jgi:hypothetical protein
MADYEITDVELREMAARAAAATAGPWKSFVEGRDQTSGSDFIRTGGDDIELTGATTADQDFIAHAREDVPRLVNEVRALRDRLRAPR